MSEAGVNFFDEEVELKAEMEKIKKDKGNQIYI